MVILQNFGGKMRVSRTRLYLQKSHVRLQKLSLSSPIVLISKVRCVRVSKNLEMSLSPKYVVYLQKWKNPIFGDKDGRDLHFLAANTFLNILWILDYYILYYLYYLYYIIIYYILYYITIIVYLFYGF